MNASKDKSEYVIVLGAKPDSDLPDIEPKAIVAANGAIELAISYRERFGSEVISMVPGKDLYEQEHIRESIRNSVPDRLLLLGTIHIEADPFGYVEKEIGISRDKVTIVPLYERNWTFSQVFGWRRYLVAVESLIVRGVKHFYTTAIPDIFGAKSFSWMSRSTGINAIIYCLNNFSSTTEVVVAGIGLQSGGHFNNVGTYKQKTAKMDRLTMKHWLPSRRTRVQTTDPILSELGKVSRWKGDTYKFGEK